MGGCCKIGGVKDLDGFRLVMKPETFVPVAKPSELNGAGPFALSANGVDIVVARECGEWRAFAGRCPHQGALLGEGELDGHALVCRNHHWRFALNSGQRIGGPEVLSSCPVVERNGALLVDVAGLAPSARRTTATRSLDDLPGPRPLPFIGNLHQLDSTKAHLTIEGWAARYGSTYQFWMGPRESSRRPIWRRSTTFCAPDPKPFAARSRWTASLANSGSRGCSMPRVTSGARSASYPSPPLHSVTCMRFFRGSKRSPSD